MKKTKQLIIDFIDMYGDALLNNRGDNPIIDNLVERLNPQLNKADVSDQSELLLSFFLWFRDNGELYIGEPIEKMISIYEKERDCE